MKQKQKPGPIRRLFFLLSIGAVCSMAAITLTIFLLTFQMAVLLTGGVLIVCALVWIFVLTQAFGKRLTLFTSDLYDTLDEMMDSGQKPKYPDDSETLFARISH